MSMGTTPRDGEDSAAGVPATAPVAPDRPFVDGTAKTPAELRAQVDALSDERRQDVEVMRDELGDTLEELTARFDVPARARATKDGIVEQVRARRVEIIAGVASMLVILIIGRLLGRSDRSGQIARG